MALGAAGGVHSAQEAPLLCRRSKVQVKRDETSEHSGLAANQPADMPGSMPRLH